MIISCLILLVLFASPALAGLSGLPTPDRLTKLELSFPDKGPVIETLSAPGDDFNWVAPGSVIELMPYVWVDGQQIQTKWHSMGGMSLMNERYDSYINDTPKMTLNLSERRYSRCTPIELSISIRNESDKTITLSHQDSLNLLVAIPPDPVLEKPGHSEESGHSTEAWWIKRGGGNASTEGGTFRVPVDSSLDLNLESNCEDGSSPVPWLAIQSGNRGFFVGWEFSGLGRISAKAAPDGKTVDIRVGLNPDFKTDIAPGETLKIPAAFVGCYTGDIDDGSYSLHRWIVEEVRPKLPEGVADPTLAYNLYLDVGGNHAKEADVLRSARFCHDLGFETFMPDAMWFPSTGDWRWDPTRFPKGVQPIEEYVHSVGMKLALWCAWTNGGVSDDPGALSVRGLVGHPDWFTGDFGADWQPAAFSGGQVCLGCEEAKNWEIEKTQWLVGHHKLDYLKHDCGPITNHCNKKDHRHHYGVDASYWATMGYYEVQDKLRKAYPNVILENCSGGGHIKDFGIIGYTHYTVTTDTLSNLPDRQSIYDSTFAFPPILLQAYTYEWEYKVPGDDPEPFLWRSAMMGAWQIDPTRTQDWTPEQIDLARRSADIYKEWIRPMFADVKVHHILPRPDGKHWDGMFYWSPSLNRGTLYIFRPDAPENEQTVKLKGFEPEKQYWLWCEDGSIPCGQRTGADLMNAGLAIALPNRYNSDIIYLRDAKLGKPEKLEPPEAFKLNPAKAETGYFASQVELSWTRSNPARGYRVLVADSADFSNVIAEKRTVRETLHLANLPAEKKFFWKVEAIAYGGKCWNDDGAGIFETLKSKEPTGVKFISDLPWVKSTAGAGNSVHRDTNYYNKPIGIAGKTYPKGVWTHAFNDDTPADVVIDVSSGKFKYFTADAGVESAAGAGSVQFQVLADDKLVAESPVMRPGAVHAFRVDIGGAKTLTLRVTNGGDGYACDHAAWGMARLIEEDAKDPF